MRHLLLAQALLVGVCLLLIGGSMAVGAALEATPAVLEHHPQCVLPCWEGINPGRTRIDPANQIMLNMGYNAESTMVMRSRLTYPPRDAASCAVQIEHREAIVTETRLYQCPGLRLGDVLLALGRPDGVQPGNMTFYFQQGRVWAKLHVNGCASRLSPFLPVQEIRMLAASEGDVMVSWQAFMPPRDYVRQFPQTLFLTC